MVLETGNTKNISNISATLVIWVYIISDLSESYKFKTCIGESQYLNPWFADMSIYTFLEHEYVFGF